MNWDSLIKLLLPIRLRAAKLLIAFLLALTKVTRSKFDSDFAWVQNLIIDLKYTSQVQAMVQLLNDKFDPVSRTIVIEDGTDGNVSICSNGDEDVDYRVIAGENENVFFGINEEDTSVGQDFIVRVPMYVDKDIIRVFIKRYAFAGVGFTILDL